MEGVKKRINRSQDCQSAHSFSHPSTHRPLLPPVPPLSFFMFCSKPNRVVTGHMLTQLIHIRSDISMAHRSITDPPWITTFSWLCCLGAITTPRSSVVWSSLPSKSQTATDEGSVRGAVSKPFYFPPHANQLRQRFSIFQFSCSSLISHQICGNDIA